MAEEYLHLNCEFKYKYSKYRIRKKMIHKCIKHRKAEKLQTTSIKIIL